MTINFKPQSPFSLKARFLQRSRCREKVTSTTYRIDEHPLLYQRLFRQAYKIFSYKSTFIFSVIRNKSFLRFSWFCCDNIYLAFCLEIWTSTTLGLCYYRLRRFCEQSRFFTYYLHIIDLTPKPLNVSWTLKLKTHNYKNK